MATLTVAATCNGSLVKTYSLESSASHLRDASFSSYLINGDETSSRKLSDQNPASITASEPPLHRPSFNKKLNNDGEIRIFDAEKYFRGEFAMNLKTENLNQQNGENAQFERTQMNQRRTREIPRAPSSCSEASWNSNTALLRRLERETHEREQKQGHGKKILRALGCNSCSGKKSVNIEEKKPPQNSNLTATCNNSGAVISVKSGENAEFRRRKNEEAFSFPVLGTQGPTAIEKPRVSLEIFGSPLLQDEERALALKKRLLTLSLTDTGREFHNSTSSGRIPANQIIVPAPQTDFTPSQRGLRPSQRNESDVESDSSSDLFEIESFSTNSHQIIRQPEGDDFAGKVYYEPSEASIEWSVVTGNFSVTPDSGDFQATKVQGRAISKTTISGASIRRKRRSGGFFMGCQSAKAVRVMGGSHTKTRGRNRERFSTMNSSDPSHMRMVAGRTIQRSRPLHEPRIVAM
ncbi:hypothetical protein AMTRI_Chr04g252910 [Amborella trichopoda]|uniref:Uncharacterized protein n=1 Tax=Amborella trichopoda TaxID=13333 RepID=W1NH01_AMBTC|nr:protein PHYTOCHROME KINASE SUBSTRATE 1 [Amborella trichopoda]ERM94445.1 hypothetical protein AMTR_s00010p00259290 [Amborella trichopoda]|eukprot:XP_006827208.1 protein PHYTOCHROME KINASE SUBSTRATE 1 [Amborella trichopoda]